MAKKPSVTTLASGFNSTEALNNNFTNIRDQFDNTLSLDGSVPNAMEADLDINNNDLLNVNSATITTLTNTTLTGDSASFNSLTVDGANINAFTAAYKLKLDNIEDNATADQTASEIEALVSHDNLQDFVANEHIDWTTDQGSTNIHTGNYTDTTYSIGNGGLTEVNFTTALNTKLTNIEDNATADQTASEILTAVKTVDGATSGLDADLLDGQHGSYYTGYADTAISNLVDSAPSTLDTLNELAAALGDDANFSTTVTNSIATKMPLAGGTFTGNTSYGDNDKIIMGDGNDLQIYSDGDASHIDESGSGNFVVKATNIQFTGDNDESLAWFVADGAVSLYHNGSDKAQTTSSGFNVNGNITASGTVDGVDIATRDAILTSTTTTANAAMPKAGGTFTGNVKIGFDPTPDFDADVSGAVTSADALDYAAIAQGSDNNEFDHLLGIEAPWTDTTIKHHYKVIKGSSTGALREALGTSGTDFGDLVVFGNVHSDGTNQNITTGMTIDGGNLRLIAQGEADHSVTGNASMTIDAADIAVTGTVDGVDIAARDAVLTSTTTTANAAMPKSGGTFTGNISFEGATANDYETTVTVTNPTADRTITLPDRTGEVVLSSGAVGTDATALIGRGKIGYCGLSDTISVSHEDQGTLVGNLGFAQTHDGYSWVNSPSGAYTSLRVGDANVLQAHATEIIANQNIKLDTNKNLVFEGATANDYETTVTVTDPTADQTITLPNQTGTAMLWQSLWPDDPNPNGYNTVLGHQAGRDLDATAEKNTLIGQNAGLSIVSQDYNTVVGQYAYADDNTASSGNNTAVGYYALSYNSFWAASGMQYNTSIGSYSGSSNRTGDQNTFVGYSAKNYYNNSSNSVIVGYEARAGHSGNVTVGSTAARNMVNQCDRNTIVGYAAAQVLNGSDDNVYIGDRSGYRTTTGSQNTMVGGLTGFYNTLGSHNTYIGERAGFFGYNGDNNTFVGKYAGYDVEGDNNTALGYYAGSSGNMDTNANCLVLGANANPSTNSVSNEITLGDANISSLRCNVQTISSLSDERDKTAIKDLTYGLDFINDMRPVEFTWNRRDGSLGAKKDMGFIAQELWETELDHSSSSRTRLVNWENPQKLEADYVRSYPILVKAVQELSAQVTALEARIKTLEGN